MSQKFSLTQSGHFVRQALTNYILGRRIMTMPIHFSLTVSGEAFRVHDVSERNIVPSR
jgi:hypothetical protein